jgi:hypothetical protein
VLEREINVMAQRVHDPSNTGDASEGPELVQGHFDMLQGGPFRQSWRRNWGSRYCDLIAILRARNQELSQEVNHLRRQLSSLVRNIQFFSLSKDDLWELHAVS